MAGGADEVGASLLRGAVRGGVTACVYLPDSCLTSVIRAFQASPGMTMIPCAREDEGVAIAVGLYLGGSTAVCMMEASGIGYSALILARAQVQRTPVIIALIMPRGLSGTWAQIAERYERRRAEPPAGSERLGGPKTDIPQAGSGVVVPGAPGGPGLATRAQHGTEGGEAS